MQGEKLERRGCGGASGERGRLVTDRPALADTVTPVALVNRLPSTGDAIVLLQEVLPAGSDRLAHTLAVGRRAEFVTEKLGAPQASLVVTAAYLHDVGYAHVAVDTEVHQLDGARYLRRLGYDEDLCRLVAHHTFARIEARNQGLGAAVEMEFPLPEGVLADSLDLVSYCDLTTSHRGKPTTVDARLAGVFARYEPGHVVERTMREVEPFARALVDRVQARLNRRARRG
ncbi:HD domain-containing protein [Myceligenerans salitolerans]|uniref:HD domain-containing protein n=1 Tax=Myceligenerans salitolerans TaxID=1230528 RepID=A0ABS3ICF0_9MICO|nr:HD domain-containing protein [Myceligenerans salitolerans]MBO0610691.1 HD domain-containing protein [Myceligenerans salitolerans]